MTNKGMRGLRVLITLLLSHVSLYSVADTAIGNGSSKFHTTLT